MKSYRKELWFHLPQHPVTGWFFVKPMVSFLLNPISLSFSPVTNGRLAGDGQAERCD
jgi:hypothetical protein